MILILIPDDFSFKFGTKVTADFVVDLSETEENNRNSRNLLHLRKREWFSTA